MTTIDWSQTRNDIIKDAFQIIGVVPLGEEPSAEQLDVAIRALNRLTKFMEANNLFLWNYGDEEVTPVNATSSYTFTSNNAIGVDEAYWLDSSSQKNFLEVIPHAQYRAITDPATAGQPLYIAFDRSVNAPSIKLYPTPDTTWIATVSGTKIYVRTARRLRDWDSASDQGAGDIWPRWWVQPLVWKLAADLSHTFRLPLQERAMIEAKAEGLINGCKKDNFNQNDRMEVLFTDDRT